MGSVEPCIYCTVRCLVSSGAVDHLFQQVAEAARLNLQLSALRAFVQSRYYSR